MREPDFSGATIVVTGGGLGLGLGMVRRFAQVGAHTVITEMDAAVGARAAASLRGAGLAVSFEALDVRDPGQSRALVDRLVGERGRIDVWVNNAGVECNGPAETLATDGWEETVKVILSGAFYCSQAVGRQMLAQGRGVIVNVAAVNGYKAIEGRVASCSAKAGVIMLTQALGIEWAGRGVRVAGVAPSVLTDLVQSPVTEGWASEEVHMRRTPLGRLGTVEEVADAVLFLASDEAAYITAETLRVDGGWVAYQLF